mmetsp:Transcript_52240/g.134763  ORF Transcript_52240/g.134763 Transcript_52240/m.134763 type:complete len:140 (+) Transcript_52240:2-421(+)
MQVIAKWDDDDAKYVQTLTGFNYLLVAYMQPYVGIRSYYNYLDENMPGGALPREAYFGPNAERVVAIRDKYVDLRPTSRTATASTEWELAPFREGIVADIQPTNVMQDAAGRSYEISDVRQDAVGTSYEISAMDSPEAR